MKGYLSCSWWRSAFLRDFTQAQCFSFVLIRHSQSCWLQGWFHSEIISLIKRSSNHEQASVIKPHSIRGSPSSLKALPTSLSPLSPDKQKTRKRAKLPGVAALTHLRRWKTVTVISEAVATAAEQQGSISEGSLSLLFKLWVHAGWSMKWSTIREILSQIHLRLSKLRPFLRTVGHSQRARLNNWSMNVQWKQKHSLALYFPSPPVMCIESHRSINYMQSSAELKGIQVHFNYSASL